MKVFFVAQFFENETIPDRHPTEYAVDSDELQVFLNAYTSALPKLCLIV